MASLDSLISKVVVLLESEASLIANVRDDLREMQLELETMRSFLKDADSAAPQTVLQATWVSQVRDSAFKIQDIIEEFEYHKNKYRALGNLRSFVYKSIHFPQDLWLKHRLALKLQKVKSAVDAISNRRQRYEVDRSKENVAPTDPHSWLRVHHESALFLKDDEVVGFRNAKRKIGGWLMSEEMERIVVSVWGPGGSGKTTLVANVYNNPKIKRHFHCYAWVTVSQTYEIRDILLAIIKNFCKSRNEHAPVADVGSMDYRSLVDFLGNYLEDKRYVIVLDDVWDLHLWNQLRIALPNNTQGSRVMISTRSKEIASYSYGVNSYVHHNEPLEQDEAFDLFCRKAFSNNPCPNNLKQIASNLVNKCEGLPLALVTLGGAMSNKSEPEWRMVDSSLTWQLSNSPDLQKMKTILLLSYHALPHPLKLCFLYCSIFPEDYLMQSEKLTRLWLAEGFLEEVGGLMPEQVAERYLVELVRRSLLQVTQIDPLGLPEKCKMHDILRELAISISVDEKFCSVCKDKKAIVDKNCHILSLQEIIDLQNEPQLRKNLSKVRSFFLFNTMQVELASIELPRGFHLLRVLHLEGLNIDKVPNEIVNCYNLRYLNLAYTKVRELPKLIGNLTQLRTLDLRQTYIQVLPIGITKLHHLRHLIVTCKSNIFYSSFADAFNAVQVTPHIERLVNLQVLMVVQANVDLVGKLGSLTNLRRLGLERVTEEMEKEMCLAINKMEHLHSLDIMTADENVVLHLESLSSTAPRLKFLSVSGKLERVTSWFQCLHNLNHLCLYWSKFEDDILPYIDELPNLTDLDLYNACVSEQLYFRKGFRKLKQLIISSFPQLKQIIIEEGVMPNIEKLLIVGCVELEIARIKYLASLQIIVLKDASSKVVSQIREGFIECEHQPKIIVI